MPKVGAGEDTLDLADVALDRQGVGELVAGVQLQHRLERVARTAVVPVRCGSAAGRCLCAAQGRPRAR